MPSLSTLQRFLTTSKVVEGRRKADALAERGIHIVDLGIGEPAFNAPAIARAAAIEALRAGHDGYLDPRGLPELRAAIAKFEREAHGIDAGPGNVIVTVGSYGALALAIRAVLDPGDEVLLLEPFWSPYASIARIANGVPVIVPGRTRDGVCEVAFDAIARAVTPRTRAIVINTPNNPSGRVYSETELAGIAAFATRHDLWIISDETYAELVFDGARHRSMASLGPEVAARTIVTSSFSKAFAMTGWRLGYAIAPQQAADLLVRINHMTVRSPTSFVQYAAVAALERCTPDVQAMRAAYASRRDLMVERLRAMPGIACDVPAGTFYAFPQLPAGWGDGDSFCALLLEEAGVIATPGSYYGAAFRQHIRFSFAASLEEIGEGMDRMLELATRRFGGS
jgi:aspartate aminotransferase